MSLSVQQGLTVRIQLVLCCTRLLIQQRQWKRTFARKRMKQLVNVLFKREAKHSEL